MKQLSENDLRVNDQAASVAAGVLGESVEAATRCEQVTEGQQLEAAGVGAINRGMLKGMKSMNRAMMPRLGSDMKDMKTGGLPSSFVLAVTAKGVHAIEDKRDGDKLVAGKVLKSWERDSFVAKASMNPGLAASSGVPDDRQLLIIYLPMEGAKSRYMKAAARNVAASGSPGMPHKVMVAKDAASQKVMDAVVSRAAPGANVMIGGRSLQDMMAQAGGNAQAAADPTERLSRLADLRDRGVLTDEEFAAQKAAILGG
jgi:hypothetical protein